MIVPTSSTDDPTFPPTMTPEKLTTRRCPDSLKATSPAIHSLFWARTLVISPRTLISPAPAMGGRLDLPLGAAGLGRLPPTIWRGS